MYKERRGGRRLVAAITLVGVVALQAPAHAGTAGGAIPPIRKLGRGLANFLTGPLEIPITMRAVDAAQGPIAGLFLGLLVGTGAAVIRSGVGAVEAVTFLFPMGDMGYEPLIQPEFLFEPESGQASGGSH